MSSLLSESAVNILDRLCAGNHWNEAFESACKVEDSERTGELDDRTLITIYQECLTRGLTFQADPEAFLEACKRLSRLLFRYGRAREANNYLLQLRDLSPDPSNIPAWAWAYSAKLAYLEDLEYCIRKPREVLDYIESALAASPSSPQASAVLADFINTAAHHLTEKQDSATAANLSRAIRGFLDELGQTEQERVDHALSKLELLPELTEDAPAADPDSKPATELPWQQEAEQLRTQLERAAENAENLAAENAELQKQNQELRLELHLLRELSEEGATAITRLARLIDRLDAYLEQLRSDWQNKPAAKPAVPAAPKPPPPPTSPVAGATLPPRSRIIVIGESRAAEIHLLGICKAMGLEKDQVDFRLSYEAFDKLDIGSLQYNDSVAGILIGPVPHKVPGQDDPVKALMRGEGYPPTVRIETNSGLLKITKSSFREALENLLTRIASLEPSLH